VLAAVYDRIPPDIANTVEMLLNQQTLTIQDSDVVSATRPFSKTARPGDFPAACFSKLPVRQDTCLLARSIAASENCPTPKESETGAMAKSQRENRRWA
jgi:hypothetical protein